MNVLTSLPFCRSVLQQYSDWYTGRWWVGCYIWYSEEGPLRAGAPPSPFLAVPNVTATHRRPVYQLDIIWCGTISASGLLRVKSHLWRADTSRDATVVYRSRPSVQMKMRLRPEYSLSTHTGPHPSPNSICSLLPTVHLCDGNRVKCPQLQRLQRYRELTRFCWLGGTYKHLSKYLQPLTRWSTPHSLQDVFQEPRFGLSTHTRTARQTDVLKSIPVFTIAAGKMRFWETLGNCEVLV